MSIRAYSDADFAAIRRLHEKAGLPSNCFPPLANPNMIVKLVAEHDGRIVQFGGVKLTGEAFVLADHSEGTPQERWDIMQRLIASGLRRAADASLDDVTCFVPPELEKSFGPRLESLGWVRSPWPSWTALLK